MLSELAFDSCQSRIIYAEGETAVTGQIINCNGYIISHVWIVVWFLLIQLIKQITEGVIKNVTVTVTI
jgi:hypothetical protein